MDKSIAAAPVYFVVPKRHARRAVTRNLIRRQMRAALQRRRGGLPRGVVCLLRQRSAFAAARFPSALSPALRAAVQAELEQLFDRAERSA